jgi:ABC-type Fe3+-hydroxamate transport system substrate-binding protein
MRKDLQSTLVIVPIDAYSPARTPRRVVSLVPSLTETLFSLGVADSVVGLTAYCIFPDEARRDRTDVGGTKNPKVDRIRELRPDVVYMNLEENLKRHAEEIASFTTVVVSEPKTVDDVAALMTELGRAHGVSSRARELDEELREARQGLEGSEPFRFACPIWKDPWMWCGADTYVSSLVAEAGGENVVTEPRYPTLTVDEVIARGAETIFLPDEPYEFTEDDAVAMQSVAKRVIGPFPGHLFTWHGVRTIHGLSFLAQMR